VAVGPPAFPAKPARGAEEEKNVSADAPAAVIIHAPVLPPAIRHQTIFGVFEALPVSYSALLINDHDPKPLIYQLQAEKPDVYRFEYVERGPERYALQVTRQR
jgi:uncharacterized protein (DUF2249 family)